jgi:hypothetical protein
MYQLTAAARVSLATLPAVTLFVISRSAQCAIMSLEIIYIALYIHLRCDSLIILFLVYTCGSAAAVGIGWSRLRAVPVTFFCISATSGILSISLGRSLAFFKCGLR